MKKLTLSLLAILSVGLVGTVRADESFSPLLTPAERNVALFGSGAPVQVNQIYIYSGRRYRHRAFVGYRTQRVVYRDGYGYRRVSYRRVAVYRYW